MRRKVASVVAWLVATVASILLATAAVGSVDSWGQDQPAAQATVSSLVTLPSTTSTSAPTPVATSSTAPSTTAGTTTSTTIAAAPEPTTAPPTSPPPTTTRAPVASTTSTPPTTTAPPQNQEHFESRQLVGGWVQLRINGDNVYLEAAVAEPGFSVDVEHNGPESVEVKFKSESHDSKLHAKVDHGRLDIKIEEESDEDHD